MASLTLEGLAKTYGNGQIELHGLDLAINEGEFVVFVGGNDNCPRALVVGTLRRRVGSVVLQAA